MFKDYNYINLEMKAGVYLQKHAFICYKDSLIFSGEKFPHDRLRPIYMHDNDEDSDVGQVRSDVLERKKILEAEVEVRKEEAKPKTRRGRKSKQ